MMTSTLVSVEPDATALQAARLMLQHPISGLRRWVRMARSARGRKANSCAGENIPPLNPTAAVWPQDYP